MRMYKCDKVSRLKNVEPTPDELYLEVLRICVEYNKTKQNPYSNLEKHTTAALKHYGDKAGIRC